MELVKTSESYNLVDTTEIWNILGSVHKEVNGLIRVSISVNKIADGNYVGNFSYTINTEGNVSVNFDCGKNYDSDLFAYGNLLVDQVVSQLK